MDAPLGRATLPAHEGAPAANFPTITSVRSFGHSSGMRPLVLVLFAVVLVLLPVAPALAQTGLEETDDTNKNAVSPEECVRPEMPGGGDLDVEGAMAYNESKQLYEECLERTEGNSGDDGDSGEDSGGTGLDPIAANENASQPEECVKPETPDGDGAVEGADYVEQQEAYDDCLARTGSDDGSGDENAGGEATSPDDGSSECVAPPDDASMAEKQEYEGCLAGSGQLANDEPTVAAPSDGGSDTGGITGLLLDGFKGVMGFIWDWTFGWALQEMSEAFETDLLSLPTLEGRGDLLGYYKGAVETLRPAILVGILVLGILMTVRSDNYDLAYAGFQGLPRLMGIAMALAFLPQFMGELSRITGGITDAFYPGGQDIDAAGQQLFKASIGNMAVTNFLNLILLIGAVWVGGLLVIVCLLNKVLYAVLFVSGAFALTASIVPSLQSLAGSWFRGILASAAIPALWSIELGVGSLAVTSPESIFGSMTNSLGFVSENAVVSLGAIITMWIMYKTPFKCVEWAFNVQLPGRGGLMSLAKTGAALAVGIPAKTAITQATKNLMNRSSGGASVPKPKGDGSGTGTGKPTRKGLPGKDGAGKSNAARTIQQTRVQGQRDRQAANVSKAHSQYARQRDRDEEHKERFMRGGRSRNPRGPGMAGSRSGARSGSRSAEQGRLFPASDNEA
ncbi:hypothetical protein GBA63_19660 [Rubrobacter tropicus]|uniref:TrbL/VirB6 plasmid conjugal transfer protein n=1 Tax=Rubrobacter tropicus TaxID=2653851 RepID=A0A6G8QEF3_9ACTN|nr:hypothetical protein [Rubrobacter tropicus]QIN84617.1 hypothetical protein GBA63_19660 [Rubrobacter tropicus]